MIAASFGDNFSTMNVTSCIVNFLGAPDYPTTSCITISYTSTSTNCRRLSNCFDGFENINISDVPCLIYPTFWFLSLNIYMWFGVLKASVHFVTSFKNFIMPFPNCSFNFFWSPVGDMFTILTDQIMIQKYQEISRKSPDPIIFVYFFCSIPNTSSRKRA